MAERDPSTLSADVSRAVVVALKELYGRGPVHAKTYFCDEFVFCVLSGGFTRDEETMMRAGEHETVRAYRLKFQRIVAPELVRRVEDALGKKVIGYHSQVIFDPDRIVEMFIVDPEELPGTVEDPEIER